MARHAAKSYRLARLRRRLGLRPFWERRRARLLPDRLVNAILIVAVGYLVLHAVLSDVPEVFRDGARLGDVLNNLALAYVAAWIFQLLVVARPRARVAAAALRAAWTPVTELAALVFTMQRPIERALDIEVKNYEFFELTVTEAQIRDVLLPIAEAEDKRSLIRDEPLFPDWGRWRYDGAALARDTYQRLLPLLPQLPEEVSRSVHEACAHPFVTDWQRGFPEQQVRLSGTAALAFYDFLLSVRQLYRATGEALGWLRRPKKWVLRRRLGTEESAQ